MNVLESLESSLTIQNSNCPTMIYVTPVFFCGLPKYENGIFKMRRNLNALAARQNENLAVSTPTWTV
jgi:hypothetical protein